MKNKIIILSCILLIAACSSPTKNVGKNQKVKTEKPVNKEVEVFNAKDTLGNDIKVVQKVDSINTQNASIIDVTAASSKNNIESFYKKYKKEVQKFKVNLNKAISVKGKEGTIIKIPSNSLVRSNGKKASGDAEIQLTEYYTLKDILLANLSTRSNDKLLETGGMVNISVIKDGKELSVAKKQKITIEMPTKSKKENMELFNGEQNDLDEINWVLSNNVERVLEITSQQPAGYKGGDEEMYKFLSENVKYPVEAKKSGVEGRVYVEFEVSELGEISNVKILRGIGGGCDEEAIRVVSSMPKWIPAKKDEKNVASKMTLPLNFVLSGDNQNFQSFGTAKFQESFDIKKADESELSNYVFSSSKLGWINCDRFTMVSRQKINYKVYLKEDADVKIVFNGIKSVMNGHVSNNRANFSMLPKNQSITIIALKKIDGQLYLANHKTRVNTNGFNGLDFQPVTVKEFEEVVNKLW